MFDREKLAKEKPGLPTDPKEIRDLVIRVTSGTTDAPVVRIRSSATSDDEGIEPGRVLLSFRPPDTQVGTLTKIFYNPPKRWADLFISVDPFSMDKKLAEVLHDLRPDATSGIEGTHAHLFETLNHKELFGGIVQFGLGSELSEKQELVLRRLFPNAHFLRWYRASEAGLLGVAKCRYLKRNQFHPVAEVTLEIADQDEEGIGRIVVSKRLRHGGFSRYDIGDRGKIIGICPCEKLTFEVVGRADYIKIVGVLILQRECDRVVSELSMFVTDYRATVQENRKGKKTYGAIVMDIIPTEELLVQKNPERFIAGEISRRLFVTPSRTLGDLVAEEHFLPLQVHLVDAFEAGKSVRLHRGNLA